MKDHDIYLEVLDIIRSVSTESLDESRRKQEYRKFPAFLDVRLDSKFLSREEDIQQRALKNHLYSQ